jgi:membrane-bound metal-dependent hydrolase YbcI (DUF457 family)
MAGAALTGVPLVSCAVMALISAGFALGPDIDHPGSTISRSLPGTAHRIAHGLSRVAREATSTGGDRKHSAWQRARGHDPEHRTLTHTLPAGAAVAGVAAWISTVPGGTAVLAALAVWWCHRLRRSLSPFLAVITGVAVIMPVEPALIAWAAGGGWLSHIIADGCTRSGVPLFWPLMFRGKRWYRVRVPVFWLVMTRGKHWYPRFRFVRSSLASGDRREWIAGSAVAVLMNSPLFLL